MRISIITVCFNSEETIQEAVQSVLAQRDIDLEYIIVDGGSTDKTLDILESYKSSIHTIISEPDEGMYDALNKGLRKATGDLVGILNSDDLYASDNILAMVTGSFKTEAVDAVYGDIVYVSQRDTDKVIRYWRSKPYRKGLFESGWMPPHPSFFVKRTLYEQYGYFQTNLKTAADYELMLRLIRKQGVRSHYIPEIMVKMRMGGISNKSIWNRLKANQMDLEAWRVNGLSPPWTFRVMKPLSKIKQYFIRP